MCAHTSGRLLREITLQGCWWMCVYIPTDFILFERFLCFGLSDISLFQVILGLLGVRIR